MGEPITTMKRYELKYVLSKEQYEFLTRELVGHMEIDEYGLTSIASIYYDTPDYRLIRTSIEKPPFKEKIRLRSYGLAKPGGKVFLELKRKADSIVYKRRVVTTEESVNRFFAYEEDVTANGQIARELTYFRNYYKTLVPQILIIYDRVAYKEPNGDLRLTIDQNPRYRTSDLNLYTSMDGKSLLPPGGAILEIKIQQSMPLWLSDILSRGKIYKSSFSKVGTAYTQQMQIFMEGRE